MAILTLKVKGQTLTVESEIDRIVENSINYLDFCIICDDENWRDLAKKVIVTYDKKAWEAFTVIPSETIHSPGFTISVIGSRKPGTNGENDLGEVVTTCPVAVKVFPSGATDGSDPEDTAIDFSTADELNAKIEYWISEFSANLSNAEFDLEQKIIETKKEVDEKNQLQDINIENIFNNIGQKKEGKDSVVGRIKRLNIQASGTDFITPLLWTEKGVFDNLPTYSGIGTITNKVAFENFQVFNEKLDFLSYNGIKFCIALYKEDESLIDYTDWVSAYSFTPHENDTIKPAYFKLIATNNNKEISDIEYVTSSIMIYHRNQGLQASVKNIQSKIQEIENNTIKTFTEKVNLWELETGIYYLEGGYNLSEYSSVTDKNRHIVIIFKPQSAHKAVRYIHFCGGMTAMDWNYMECGYTDGRTPEKYNVVDTSRVVSSVKGGVLSSSLPTVEAMYEYVDSVKTELQGDIDNISILVGGAE